MAKIDNMKEDISERQKNTTLCIILSVIWFFPVMGRCLAFADSNSFAPPSGETLLLVGQDRDTIAHYVSATGNTPGGTMLYTSIQAVDGLDLAKDYGSGQIG